MSPRLKARTRCCRSCRCRPAFRSARLPSASPVPSMPACSQPPCSRCPTSRSPNGSHRIARRKPLPSPKGRRPSTKRRDRHKMARREPAALAPGATIGILGGGQLARMMAQAASRIGLNCHVYTPEPDSCAFEVVRRHTLAAYEDQDRLAEFARTCDVITYEFENVPAQTAAFLAQRKPVLPDPKVLAITQDRLIEKDFIEKFGIATAPYAAVGDAAQLFEAAHKIGLPAILKTRRLGYDGKGQQKIDAGGDPAAAWLVLHRASCILEGFVPFEREISVVVARAHD